MTPLHQRLNLYVEGNDTYIFVPDGVDGQTLTIHRSSGDIVLNPHKTPIPTFARRSGKPLYGIIGLISLSLSEYVIVISGRELQARLMGHDIYRATEFDLLPLNPNVSAHNPPHAVEAHLLALVRSHLYGGNFLFSYTWDLTRRLQAQSQKHENEAGKSLWEVADDRFFWNRFIQTRLIDLAASDRNKDYGSYILPILFGTFDLRPVFLRGRHMQLCLISRRSRFRAGTRYFRRGIDRDGHVANFNETEQILLLEGQPAPGTSGASEEKYTKLSFVQIRGSVPVFWSEINTLRYKPDLQIMDLPETASAMRSHLTEQVEIYGEEALVNLVNHTGHEKPVKDAYERYVALLDLPKVRYEYFDFHNECRKMRWDRISLLIDKMMEDLERHSYFSSNPNDPTSVNFQKGVVRTNCMDNLDRTNVVQASLARWTLNRQLRELGILSPEGSIDDVEAVSKDFREMWADHADAIAKAYGGSGALKSDFTRTNKRTRKGAIEDGFKSTMRYLKNNFFDGAKQDGFDLVTGVWIPRKSPSSSLFLISDTRPLITRSMPAIASFSLFMICAGLTLPRSSDYSLFYYFLLWLTLFSMALAFITIHGIDYVAWPRLNPLTDIIYYNGPGFRSAHHGKGLKGKTDMGPKRARLANGRVRTGPEEVELGSLKKRVD